MIRAALACVVVAVSPIPGAAQAVAPQEVRLRGEVELSIGAVVGGDPAYLFERVDALARGGRGRIYVADSGPGEVRVFDADGNYLYLVGGRGEGPGEFGRWRLCGLAFDLEGRLWVNHFGSFKIFGVGGQRAEYSHDLVVRDAGTNAVCGNPMFAGPTGLTVPRSGHWMRTEDEHVHVAANGEVLGRVANVQEPPDFGEWTWPVYALRTRGGEPTPAPHPPPFAARVLVAHAPDAGFAQVFSPVYDIRIYEPDGTPRTRVRRERVGPLITDAESRRGYEEFAKERADITRGGILSVEGGEFEMPDRKPVINHMWYDDDGRLWVFLWPAEADTMYEAHIYDADGAFLHVAEWPRGIGLWYGGLSGDVALGVRTTESDIQQVVRLRFLPSNESRP